MAPPAFLDQAALHKLWSALPANRCDRSFWNGLEAFCEPFLDEHCPLRSHEYFTVPHTGRLEQKDLHLIDKRVVEEGNESRMLYDAFTLWNPFALAALLKVPISVVIEQLLLAVEYNFMSMEFVVSCRSCAFDLKHFTTVKDVPLHGTYHTRNAFRCPMCTDRTDVTSLSCVNVFFQLRRLHPVFQRPHHRSFVTELADKQRLETFFCPSGAGFATPLFLPRGKYLLCAPFMAGMVELDVQVSAAAFGDKDPFLPRIIDLKNYCVEPASNMTNGKLKIGGWRRTSGFAGGNASMVAGSPNFSAAHSQQQRARGGAGGNAAYSRRSVVQQQQRRGQSQRTSRVGTALARRRSSDRGSATDADDSDAEGMDEFGGCHIEDISPTQCLELKHGKVQLRVYNTTAYSGFMDLYVMFDRCTEFSAVKYPKQFTLPDLLHCLPRGLRSRHLVSCTPLPPSETPTKGVFVRHYFDFDAGDFTDSQVLAVIREVHRYSLEDQHGLLLSVSGGGTCFECSFLSVTAALASSICFFQRVLVRLNESVAMALRTSITEGPMLMAAYQGQYNDADNMRSAYPDVQFVGPAVFASNHPPVVPPTLYATLVEAPTLPIAQQRTANGGALNEFRVALLQEKFDLATAAAAVKEAAKAGTGPNMKSFMPWIDDVDESARRPGTSGLPSNGTAGAAAGGAGGGADGFSIPTPVAKPQQRKPSEVALSETYRRPRSSFAVNQSGQTKAANAETMVRFELRSVRRSLGYSSVALADIRGGSVPLSQDYAVHRRRDEEQLDSFAEDPFGGVDGRFNGQRPIARGGGLSRCVDDDDDLVLPHFLKYLVEQLEGTRIVEEPHALVVMVPMSVMHAAVQLSNMLDRSSYIKEYLGPF